MPAYMIRLPYSSDVQKYLDSAASLDGLNPMLLAAVANGLEEFIDKTRLPVAIPSKDTAPGDVNPAKLDYLVPCRIDESDLDNFRNAAFTNNHEIFFNPPIVPAEATCSVAPIGSAQQVRTLLKVPALQAAGLDGYRVHIAIVDTGINLESLKAKLGPYGILPHLDLANSYSENPNVPVGQADPNSHGTMVAFNALLAAPRATLLDMNWAKPGVSASQPLSYDALDVLGVYTRLRSVRYKNSFGLFAQLPMVINNSWAVASFASDAPVGDPDNYSDNPKHALTSTVCIMADEGMDFVFGAGNCGPTCPSGYCSAIDRKGILGVHSSPDVLTVGAIATTGELAGYSQRGPGVVYTKKPDLVAWSHYAGYNAPGPDTGTSTASPVAAGVIAAYRTLHPFTPNCDERAPRTVFDMLRKTARPIGKMGWDPGYGYGIIDPIAFLQACHRQDPSGTGKTKKNQKCICTCGFAGGSRSGLDGSRGPETEQPKVLDYPVTPPRPGNRGCCCCCSEGDHGIGKTTVSRRPGLSRLTQRPLSNPTGVTSIDWSTVPWTDIPWTDIPWTDIPWTDIPWTDIPWTDIPWTDIPWTDIPWTDIESQPGGRAGGCGCGASSGCSKTCGCGANIGCGISFGCRGQMAGRGPRPCGCR